MASDLSFFFKVGFCTHLLAVSATAVGNVADIFRENILVCFDYFQRLKKPGLSTFF